MSILDIAGFYAFWHMPLPPGGMCNLCSRTEMVGAIDGRETSARSQTLKLSSSTVDTVELLYTCNLVAMASNLLAMASNLLAMASNLLY